MTNHTPGPWVANDNWALHGEARPEMMDYRVHVKCIAPFTENEHGGFERIETQVSCIVFGRTPDEAKANARLIAAAPEMLEALQNMVSMAAPKFSDEPQILCLEIAKEAIEKATGES